MQKISLEEVANAVAVVASKVAGHRSDQEHAISQQAVLMCAVAALVHTHPYAESFAEAFRQCWKLSGLDDQRFQKESPAHSGIAEALSMLERLCQVRLSVRPPDQAARPVGEDQD